MSAAANKLEFLAAQMADHEANWSLGTFGAIAEFMRGADEPVALSRSGAAVAAVTARGGIRIEAREDVRLFASESTTRESWSHRVSLCLPPRHGLDTLCREATTPLLCAALGANYSA